MLSIAGEGRSTNFCTVSATTCEASSPYPSEHVAVRVPLDLIIAKLELPIFEVVIFEGVPTALFKPSLIASLSVLDDVKL